MAQVVIRNIDDAVVERLKARAEVLAEVDLIRAMTPPRPPGAPLAEDLIREDRNIR